MGDRHRYAMLNITQAIQANSNCLTLTHIDIYDDTEGHVVLQGIAPMQIRKRTINAILVFKFKDSLPAKQALEWLILKDTKSSGFGLPKQVELMLDEYGCVLRLIGEPYSTTHNTKK